MPFPSYQINGDSCLEDVSPVPYPKRLREGGGCALSPPPTLMGTASPGQSPLGMTQSRRRRCR